MNTRPDTRGVQPARAATAHPGAAWLDDFGALEHEWRRLLAEAVGTFFLVVAAAGGAALHDSAGDPVGRAAAVTAPGLTVMALILALGAVSGVHLNPAVSVAFALRGEFPWRRVPGYLAAQAMGAFGAAAMVAWLGPAGSDLGSTKVGLGLSTVQATAVEAVLTFGLVSIILGTASSAQNIGHLSALAVGGYIAAAGLWASPLTGASMNPIRSIAPAVMAGRTSGLGVFVVGPLAGALLAVAAAHVFRGAGRDPSAAQAAQGD